jgi:uncharacterized protein YndB with AHSA1/START domain
MKSSTFKLSFTVAAKPADVFAALTEARQISKWSGQKGKVTAKVGGKFEMFDGWVKGKVIKFKPSKELSYTWHPGDWPEGSRDSVVKYKLSAAKAGTKVALEHSGFPNEKQKNEHKSGWKEFVFDPLNKHFSPGSK